MDADLDTLATALYVHTDDWLKDRLQPIDSHAERWLRSWSRASATWS